MLCFILALIISLGLAPSGVRHAEPRQISVDVRVTDQSGNPIANVPLRASGREDGVAGHTDASGACTLAGTVKDDYGRVLVTIGPFYTKQSTRFRQDLARMQELYSTYALKYFYVVPLKDGAGDYQIEIVAYPAVKVRGRLVNADGAPVEGSVAGFDRRWMPIGRDGVFEISGVRKSAEIELLFNDERSTSVHSLTLAATQTVQDVDVGDVKLSPIVKGSAVDLAVTNSQKVWPELCGMDRFVSLISSDAKTMLQVRVGENGQAIAGGTIPAAPTVPPGEYFLVAGPLQGSRIAGALVKLLRDGRTQELIANKAPRITVTDGVQPPVQFDAIEAERAIRALAGD